LYSSDGIAGYEENGARFVCRKNLFGDITAIYQGTTKLAEYVYDAWGNCTIIQNTNGIGTRNPFRYRGYYWDEDLKMYYLMTRYYDPKTGRFINADSFEYLDPNKINGLNLYAYCRNNPIMCMDSGGNSPVAALFALTATALLTVWLYSYLKAYTVYCNDDNIDDIDNQFSPIIVTVLMGHDETYALIDNVLVGKFLGNITATVSTQHSGNNLLYGFVDCGKNEVNVGSGINLGIFGANIYTSTNIGVGVNVELLSLITIGAQISLLEGFSFSVGAINGNTTYEVNFNVGWGGLALALATAKLAYLCKDALIPILSLVTPVICATPAFAR
jgi:RHS repeat-associated protein